MATPFVDAEVIYSASATVDTASINLGSDAGRSVEVVVTCPDGVTISEARIIGGAILTQRSTGLFGTGNYARRYVFADVVTETGGQAIRITSSGSGLKYGYVVSRSGVGSIRGSASDANNTAPNDQPSVDVTTVAGDTVSLIGHDCERGGTFTPGGGATERVDDGSAYVQDQIATTTNTTSSGAKNTAGPWVAGVTALVPLAPPAVEGAVTEAAAPADALTATRTHAKDQPEAVTAAETTSASISSLPPGTFTSGIFSRNGGEENSALTALTYVSVCNPTTGLQLSLRTGLSTSGTGQLVFTDPVMVAGTAYLVEWLEVGGHRGWDVQVAT